MDKYLLDKFQIWNFDLPDRYYLKKKNIYIGILVVSGFALFFALFHICPIFCPHFLPLPLPSFFVEGKGEGKKWGQNIGQMWKRAKLKAKLEGKNIRGRGQNTGQKCEFIWNNSWAPKTPNIKTTELIWTDCTFPTFIWSLLSLFKFEKKMRVNGTGWKKSENVLLMFCEIKDFKISYRYCIIDLEQMVRHWCRSGTTRQNRFHEFSESFQIGLIPPSKV